MVRLLSSHKVRLGRRPLTTFVLLSVLALLASCASITSSPPGQSSSDRQSVRMASDQWSQPQVTKGSPDDTIAHAAYLSEIERQVIIEINSVRVAPAEYARRYLVPMRAYYHNKRLKFPGEKASPTVEGLRALDECINELQAQNPLLPLYPKKGLVLAARDHANDQGRTGKTGHTGSDGSAIKDRLNRYGRWKISIGENINYGNEDARRIVASFLIDDGVVSRGHRKNLLNGTYNFVGVGCGRHRVYRCMCVVVFAGAYN